MPVIGHEAAWPTARPGVRVGTVLQWALFLLVLGNLGRIPFLDLGNRQAPILLNDLIVGAVLVVGATAAVHARSLRLNDVSLTALGFIAIGALSAVAAIPRFGLSIGELIGSLAYLARWVFYFLLYIVVLNSVRENDTERLWSALEAAVLLIAAFGIVQAAFLPNFAFMVYPEGNGAIEWDEQKHRLVSTVLEPNVVAGMLVIVLVVQVARLAFGGRTAIWKPMLLLGALVLTLSRSGALAFAVGVFVVFAIRGFSKRVIRFFVAVGLICLAGLPQIIKFASDYKRFDFTTGSALARVDVWQRAIAMFLEHPWFGIGFNTFGFVQERLGFARSSASTYSAEGGLLFVAVMTGLVGLAIYLVMLWFVLRRCRRGWRDTNTQPSQRSLFVGTAAATVAILIHSIFVNSLLVPFVMEMLWVLWALSFLNERAVRQLAQRP